MSGDHAALFGLLVGLFILWSTNNFPLGRRNLANHAAPPPETPPPPPSPSPSPNSSNAILWKGSLLTWNKVDDNSVRFKLTTSPIPKWFAVGFSHAEKGKSLMIGPPASEAILCEMKKSGILTVGHITLDAQPPTNIKSKPLSPLISPESPITSNSGSSGSSSVSSSSAVIKGDTAIVTFLIVNKLGNYQIPGKNGKKHTFVFAYGEINSGLGISYHANGRKGSLANIDFSDTMVSTKLSDSVPYYEMHGGSLATIWSVTTLIGGAIARYFRAYKWWITAHQFLQTVASVLSFPLTFLSWQGKGGSKVDHYTSVHGLFGIIFATAASIQGFLGTFAHASYIHKCGLKCKFHRFMHGVRAAHRTLGKLLLIAATVQIMLGLRFFDPDFTTLTHAFIVYSSIAWMGIIVLEIRHQKQVKAAFILTDGSGFMKVEDLKFDMDIFEKTCHIIDSMLKLPIHSKLLHNKSLKCSTMIEMWLNSLKLGKVKKLKLKCCGSRVLFPFHHYSMKTIECLKFANYLSEYLDKILKALHVEEMMEEKKKLDQLIGELHLTIEKHHKEEELREKRTTGSMQAENIVKTTKVTPS